MCDGTEFELVIKCFNECTKFTIRITGKNIVNNLDNEEYNPAITVDLHEQLQYDRHVFKAKCYKTHYLTQTTTLSWHL